MVGEREGQEVDRWAGALAWDGPMPIELVARKQNGQWIWQPHEPEELRIQASLDPPRDGVAIKTWARTHRATRVLIVIFPMVDVPAGAPSQGAGRMGNGNNRTAAGKKRAFDADAADANADGAADADANAGTGLGERGTGPGRGLGGDLAHSGAGSEKGREGGYRVGSENPSWRDNHRAELVTGRGGRTPADGGKQGGSAGGEAGGAGNTLGLGLWGGLFDAPEAVAPLVSAGLILADANFIHFGNKFLSRMLRGMAADALRKEFSREAAQVVAREMVKVRDQLRRSPAFRNLGKLEQKARLESTEKAMERAYYEKAGAFFEREARRSEATATKYAGRTDTAGQHIHQFTTENAAAYRKMAEAARGVGGLDDLARFRKELGLAQGEGALARLDVGGRSFYGINAHGQPVNLRVNAITKTHAEADAFQQAANAGISGGHGSLYVDRALCSACGSNGGIQGLARQLGLEELVIITPQGTQVIRP